MTIDIGIVGAGDRGHTHAGGYAAIDAASVVAVADVDREAATELAEAFDVPAVYESVRAMLADADLDAVSVCVHNNLHRPVVEAAAEAGVDAFCEKPLAGTYADAKAMVEAAEGAGIEVGVQNDDLFSPETRAAKTLIEGDDLGDPYYARGVVSRRRGRPFVDGYGTPAFVSKESAGGGPVIDIGTYVLGQLLYLLGNARVQRVGGATFEHTDATYDAALVGENRDTYADRLASSGYDVEDVGLGWAHLADGSVLELRAAWHMFLPDRPSVVAGTQGGLQLDPFEFYTTTEDYEATVSIDLEEYETRQALLESESGYDFERDVGQFRHWIETIDGRAENPIDTAGLALNAMRIMDGIYLSAAAGRELTSEEIAQRSGSTAADL
ncbi:Gfo/Idh/MocA family protein [Halorhabdus sp. CUG00001]|uniref:Gfo/Idh/MocA family protein n=1 Tax=Halorhabdus sp. CUG00001 TaxID=2600297 RepID=UPI00131D2CA0|nr:Gfo/Idh/MocA family oxidoreductase [Halorhabdus sp. CUG00001]